MRNLRIGDRVRVDASFGIFHGENGEVVDVLFGNYLVVLLDIGPQISTAETYLIRLTTTEARPAEAKFHAAVARIGDDRPAQWDAEAEATFYGLMAYVREG